MVYNAKRYNQVILIMKRETLKIIILSIFSIFLFILPDILFSCFGKQYKVAFDVRSSIIVIGLGIGVALNKYRELTIIFLILCAILQLIQFAHIAYFGKHMAPYTLYMLSHEIEDVFNESSNMIGRFWWIFPIVILPFYGLYLCNKINKTKTKIAGLVLAGAICYTVLTERTKLEFEVNESRFTIANSIRSTAGYVILWHIKKPSITNYEPYIINKKKQNDVEPITIVYILGESCSYKHMSLYGYKRETTPRLKDLSRDENFLFTEGVSSAVETLSASKFSMNIIREPDNVKEYLLKSVNLFKLAKNNGFKTFYISAQSSRLLASISGVEYIDFKETRALPMTPARLKRDEYLIDLAKELDLSDRNFIVIHQGCMHSPYKDNYGSDVTDHNKFSGSEEPLIDDYDNVMLYNDYIISEIFKIFNKQKSGKFYIVFASDHSEALWENGNFGHGHLHPDVAEIPIMAQSNDKEFINKLKGIVKPNHYELGLLIANIMGYDIINPNNKDNSFFICGCDPTGHAGNLKYVKVKENNSIQFVPQ